MDLYTHSLTARFCNICFRCVTAELVLYADSPGRVHSDFCVMVIGPGELKTLLQCKLSIDGYRWFLLTLLIATYYFIRGTIRLEKSTDTDSFHARVAQNSNCCMCQTIYKLYT